MLSRLFAREPVLSSLAGSAALWAAVFTLLDAYNIHLTVTQQSAWTGLFVIVAGIIARSRVTPVK